MLFLWIYCRLCLVLLVSKQYNCIDPTDVSVSITAEGTDGQPMIARLEGNPEVWVSTLWQGGTVTAETTRGSSSSVQFNKLAFTYTGRYFIYSNAVQGDIEYHEYVFGTAGSSTPINAHVYTSTEIGGIAVDWTTNNIYWTDQVYNWVMMAKIGVTNLYHYVVTTGLDKPGGIRVSPANSLLFWTDYGTNPKIERSDLLGGSRMVIVNSNIVKPIALDIDFDTNRLYWVDTGKQTLERCDWQGNNRNTLVQGSFIASFTGFSIYKNNIFGVTNGNNFYLMNVSAPTTAKVITLDYRQAYDLDIFGEVKQPNLTSPCTSAGCSEFCVGKNSNTGFECACTHGKQKLFSTMCSSTTYVAHPVYIFTKNQALCWYDVWTPVMTSSELQHNCYAQFSATSTYYLGFLLSTRTLYIGTGTSIHEVTLQQGGSITELLTNTGQIRAVSVDWISQNIYWTDGTTGSIYVVDSKGRNRYKVLSSLNGVGGLVVDPATGYMYWTTTGSTVGIWRATMTGQSVTQFITTGITTPQHLCIDYTEERLYWTDSGKDVIESIKLDGSGRKVVITVANSLPFGIAIFQDHIIWTDRTSSKTGLHWIYKDGRGLARSVLQASDLGTVLLYGEYSQPAGQTNQCSSNNGGCSQLCIPKPSGRECKCGLEMVLTQDGQTCLLDPAKINQIQAPLIIMDPGRQIFTLMDAINYANVNLPVHDLLIPVAIDVDAGANLMFWTDVGSKRIYKASLYGGNQVLIRTLPTHAVPDGLAVDDNTQTIFYTDTGQKIIATIDYSGNNHRVLVSQGLDQVRSIVLDKQAKKMYWTDWGASPNIMSATYVGANMRTLAQVTNLRWPNGLTLDVIGQTLYWCDAGLSRIESINTDGTGRKLLASEAGAHYFGIVLRESYLYLTDWKSRYLKRMHKSGGSVQTIGSPLFTKAYGLVSVSVASNISTTTTRSTASTSTSTTTSTTSATTQSTIVSTTISTTRTTSKTTAKSTLSTTPSTTVLDNSSIQPTTTTGITTSSKSKTTTNTQGAVVQEQGSGLNSTLVIVLAICVIGIIALVIIVTVGVWCCIKKRRNEASSTQFSQNMDLQALAAENKDPYAKLAPPPYNKAFEGDDTYNDINDNPYISMRMSTENPYASITNDMIDATYMGMDDRPSPYVSSDYISPVKT